MPSVVDSSVAWSIASDCASSADLSLERLVGLAQRPFGPLPRLQDRLGVLQRHRAEQRFLVLGRCHRRPPSTASARAVPSHPGPDLRECRIAARGRVVAEGRESAVVGGAELLHWNELGRFEDPVPDLFGRLDSGIDRRDHADEHALIRLQVRCG